ncbi:hypothetical protein V6N13_106603 [Hibiscus sabdariffa]
MSYGSQPRNKADKVSIDSPKGSNCSSRKIKKKKRDTWKGWSKLRRLSSFVGSLGSPFEQCRESVEKEDIEKFESTGEELNCSASIETTGAETIGSEGGGSRNGTYVVSFSIGEPVEPELDCGTSVEIGVVCVEVPFGTEEPAEGRIGTTREYFG